MIAKPQLQYALIVKWTTLDPWIGYVKVIQNYILTLNFVRKINI